MKLGRTRFQHDRRGRGRISLVWIALALIVVLALLSRLDLPLWRTATQHPPGVLVADAPAQTDLPSAEVFEHGDFRLHPRAQFRLDARVLHQAIYRFDEGAALAPVDLLLGWQRMSDSAVLAHFRFSQSFRWGRWKVDAFPIPEGEIQRSAANMHMIPADAAIERVLRRLRSGDLVRIEGLLVDARRARDDWRWNTSMTRNDTGHGACELVYVQSIELL